MEEFEMPGEHHDCPFMSNFIKSTKKAKEIHDSPFYQQNIKDPNNLNMTMWEDKSIPTAVFHGFGDACINPGMINFNHHIKEGTGAPVKCIEVGIPSLGEVFNNMEKVAEESCSKLAADPEFAGEFNVVGLSQGGLLARYIVEECDMPGKVRNMVTLGGPHMGVGAIPHCFEGFICNTVNWFARHMVYWPIVQDLLVPAGYFRDYKNLKKYEEKSVFLPALNNEKIKTGAVAEMKQSRFADLNGAMMVMFSEDTMIYPKETAWFQQLDTHGKLLPLNGTDFYNQDYIGLKSLTEAGKAQYVTFEGDHLQFSYDDIKNTIVPFLNQ